MGSLIEILNEVHATDPGELRVRLLDLGLDQALATNETGYIAVFAKLAADTCEELGRLDRAVQYLELIALHVGNDAFTYLSLGRLALKLGQREQALLHFRTCHAVALRKRGQKKVIKFLEEELRKNGLVLADLNT